MSYIKHACPKCGAAIGEFCVTLGNEPFTVHLVRRALGTRYSARSFTLTRREERELKRHGLPTFGINMRCK